MKPEPLAIEHATLSGWPAREREMRDGWVLCATSGVSGRVNACWPLDWRGGDLDGAIAGVETWYAVRGLATRFRTSDGVAAPAELAATLARRGYAETTPTLTMIGSLSSEPGHYAGVTLSPSVTPAFEALLREEAPDAADYAERLDVAKRAPAPVAFAARDGNGEVACIGMCAVTGDLAGIFLMRTAASARRQGHGLNVVRALTDWAAAQGANYAYLQVEADNAPAIALYEREGFTPLYRYVYWRRAPAP